MSFVSMRGAGSVGETADFLKARFSRDYALAEELRRVENGAGSAFLLFESSGLLTRTVELLALVISGDGKTVTVDAFGHASGSIWSDEDALPLYAQAALSERGFAENDRGSWRISGSSADVGNEAPDRGEVEYVSPLELAKLGARGGKQAGGDETGARTEPAKAEKTRKRRGKRSYDPEL